MKNIKILFGITCLFIIILLFNFYAITYVWKIGAWANDNVLKNWAPYYTIANSTALLFAFCFIALGLFYLIKKGVFIKKGISLLKIGGSIMLFISILDLTIEIWSMTASDLSKIDMHIAQIMQSIFIIIIGIITIAVTDILKNGLQIQQEHELTI